MKIDQGWLLDALQVSSPNCDHRPPDIEVDLLVVHGISLPPGEFGGPWIDHLFTNCLNPAEHPYFASIAGLEVSAHVLIRRNGGCVQYVNFDERAWHAGQSCFDGRERCNDYSIGIELEGADDIAYEPLQYARLSKLAVALMQVYPGITPQRIVGHKDIAPGRKTDPGPAFDWGYFQELLEAST